MSLGDDVGDGDGWDWEGGPLNSRADAFNYATGSKQKKEGEVSGGGGSGNKECLGIEDPVTDMDRVQGWKDILDSL